MVRIVGIALLATALSSCIGAASLSPEARRQGDGELGDWDDDEIDVDHDDGDDDSRADVDQGPSDSDTTPTDDDTAPSGCAGSSYLLCEDFESATSGALPSGWTVRNGWSAGTVAVATSQAHSGSKALASAVAVNGQPRATRSLASLGAAAGKHWGRVFYKVHAPYPLPSGGNVIHNTLVGLLGQTEVRVVDTVVASNGAHQFLYNLPDDSCCTGSSYDYSYAGDWHCAEWFVDASTQSFKFFYNGTEVTSVGFNNRSDGKAKMETFDGIVLGWINYQSPASPYYTSWFDDLAIDDTRIGCD